MGRAKHTTLPKLSEEVSDHECEDVARAVNFPLALIRAILQDGAAVTPAVADALRKHLHKDDRQRVLTRVRKPEMALSEPAQRYGLAPPGYKGPFDIPVTKVRPEMLLMVSDRLATGWLRVTGKPTARKDGTSDLIVPTEHGNVISAKKLSVRVAVQADGDSQ